MGFDDTEVTAWFSEKNGFKLVLSRRSFGLVKEGQARISLRIFLKNRKFFVILRLRYSREPFAISEPYGIYSSFIEAYLSAYAVAGKCISKDIPTSRTRVLKLVRFVHGKNLLFTAFYDKPIKGRYFSSVVEAIISAY